MAPIGGARWGKAPEHEGSLEAMRVFVLGKVKSLVGWVEGAVEGLAQAGHDVALGVTRNPVLHPAIDRARLSPWLGRPLVRSIVRSVTAFAPDLILAIDPYQLPLPILEAVTEVRGATPMVGWVGDVFEPSARAAAEVLDAVAYTDTGMMDLHATLGLPGPALYLSHAANPNLLTIPTAQERRRRMVFVAMPTPRRQALVNALRDPITLYGPRWNPSSGVAHEVVARRISLQEAGEIYARHMATLNIANEVNVVHGLNQRNFDPYALGTAVVAEAQPDLEACFEPGKEVLVYSDANSLNDVHARLLRDPALAVEIGRRGKARVAADHTYGRRLEQLCEQLFGSAAGRQTAAARVASAR
jgi:spore maturation protein CgeB